MVTEPPMALELLPADRVRLPAYMTWSAPHQDRVGSRTGEDVESNIENEHGKEGKNEGKK